MISGSARLAIDLKKGIAMGPQGVIFLDHRSCHCISGRPGHGYMLKRHSEADTMAKNGGRIGPTPQ